MAINCDPKELAKAAACFESCIPPGMQPAVQNWLLCQVAAMGVAGGSSDPSKVWKGLISQVGINAPTTDALFVNTLGNGVWSRNADGDYLLSFPAGTLPVLKTTIMLGSTKDVDHYAVAINNGADAVWLLTADTTTAPFTAAVDSIVRTLLEIHVWP